MASVLDDLALFMAQPPPGDPYTTAGADQVSVLEEMAGQAVAGLLRAGYTTPGVGIVLGADRIIGAALPNLAIGVGVGLTTCEVAYIQAVNGIAITLQKPLLLAHNPGEIIQVIQGAEIPAWWFGVVSNGATDDTAGWQQAVSKHTANLWINGAGSLGQRPSLVSQPIIRTDSTRIRQATFIPAATFPGDCSNAVLMAQNSAGSPSDTLPFTVAAGAIVTPVAHGLVHNLAVMFKNTGGSLAGIIEGRTYYAVNTTTTTFQLASTLQLANTGVSDVTPTAGAGTVYLQLNQKGRQFYDDLYIDCQFNPGVNAIIDSVQQPGYSNKQRADNSVAIWGKLVAGASSFTGLDAYYKVVGQDAAGNLWRTAEFSLKGSKAPDASHQAQITWGSLFGVVSGAVTWSVYRVFTNSGTQETVNSLIATTTSTTFTDTGTAPLTGTCPFLTLTTLTSVALQAGVSATFDGTARFWRVAAIDAAGNKLASNELTASPSAAQQALLTWKSYSNPAGGAYTWNVYRSTTANGEAGTNTLVTSGLASTTLTFTDTGNATNAGSLPLPATCHPGGFGLYISGTQQYVWINYESIQCDTAVKCAAAEFLWFFGFDVESCALRVIHTVPITQRIAGLAGPGILVMMAQGVHHEMPNNYVACYDLEYTGFNIELNTIQWSAGGNTSGVGGVRNVPFIWQHANAGGAIGGGYRLRNMSMTTPSVAGVTLVTDNDRALFIDSWTSYHQTGPQELIVAEGTTSNSFAQQPVAAYGPNGRYIRFGSQQTLDPVLDIGPGIAAQTGEQIITHDQVTGATGFRVLATGQVQPTSATFEVTGAGAAALGANSPAVTLGAPFKWLKLLLSDGSTVFSPVWK